MNPTNGLGEEGLYGSHQFVGDPLEKWLNRLVHHTSRKEAASEDVGVGLAHGPKGLEPILLQNLKLVKILTRNGGFAEVRELAIQGTVRSGQYELLEVSASVAYCRSGKTLQESCIRLVLPPLSELDVENGKAAGLIRRCEEEVLVKAPRTKEGRVN
jgi:hypothetical protein